MKQGNMILEQALIKGLNVAILFKKCVFDTHTKCPPNKTAIEGIVRSKLAIIYLMYG